MISADFGVKSCYESNQWITYSSSIFACSSGGIGGVASWDCSKIGARHETLSNVKDDNGSQKK